MILCYTSMKSTNYKLEDIFSIHLNELFKAEKDYLLYFDKLSASTTTEELRSALSADRSGQASHVSRLEKIVDSIEITPAIGIDELHTAVEKQLKKIVKDRKKPGLFKDIQILKVLKDIYGIKISSYSSLQVIAENLDMEHPALMLEQSLEDSRNNIAYLIQIERNIIYPQFKSKSDNVQKK